MITDDVFNQTYCKIKNEFVSGRLPSDFPKAIILGGQPGAGKSALVSAISVSGNGYVFINGDTFKVYHPDFENLGYTAEIQAFSSKVVERLIDELSTERYNLIIEGTMRNVRVPLRTAKLLVGRSYVVAAYIIAAYKEDSWASTIMRANAMEKAGEQPRYVSRSIHDEAVNLLPENVETLVDSALFENVVIMDRSREVLYNMADGIGKNPRYILECIIHGREISHDSSLDDDLEPGM